MDAQTLFSIVSKWPREAWPEDVGFVTKGASISVAGVRCTNSFDGWFIDPNGEDAACIGAFHAVMLFESAGLRHLIATGHAPESQCIDGQFFIGEWSGNRAWRKLGFGHTLIEAIAKAIMEAK